MTLRINGGKIMNKKSPIRTVLFVISAILFFAAVGSIIGGWQGLIKTRNENFIALIVAGIVFEIISVILFKKIKYYCEVCGTELRKTGRYHETGNFESSHSDSGSTLFVHIEYEYECPHCHHKTVISKKEKISSYKY